MMPQRLCFEKKKKKQGQLSFRNLFKQQVFPLFLLAAVLKHKLNFDWANLIFAALSLTLLKVIHALFPVVYAAVDVSDSRKGDNFRVMDRVLIGPFEITAVSQYLWA